jgi:hypothetical protein
VYTVFSKPNALQELGRHTYSNHFRALIGYAGHPNRAGNVGDFGLGKATALQSLAERRPLGFAANQTNIGQVALRTLAHKARSHDV